MSMHILNSGNGEMDGTAAAASGPSREELEDLIVEAYNSMQSDGEFIFLADDVAAKLHRVADLEQLAVGDEVLALPPAAVAEVEQQIAGLQVEQHAKAHEPEPEKQPEHEDNVHDVHSFHERKASSQKSHAPEFTELSSVEEIDEEAMSDAPPPLPRLRKPSIRKVSMDSPPPPPPRSTGNLASPAITYRKTPSSAPSSASKRSTHDDRARASTYEMRREAAQKLKEEKVLREQRIRDAARKQREEAKRKLELVQQQQLDEKKERVRRMKQQREQRKHDKAPPKTV